MANQHAENHDKIDFCTLGMFIIDEIEFPPPKPTVKDIVGGAGSYSALGARIFSPPPQSESVGWIVDCGSDFPPELRDFIAQWRTGVLVRKTPERLTTRGWNGYTGENEHRAFRYLTPKLRVDHESLIGTDLLWSKSFHLICSPLRCIDLIENIIALRKQGSSSTDVRRPVFIWEPVPDLCTPAEYENCLKALKYVDVVSPNHGELGGFFGRNTDGKEFVDFRTIEKLCSQWLDSGVGDGNGGVVVRCGKDGCLVMRRGLRKWMPAYHQSAEKVADPTGGGNSFLGGLAVGLLRGGSLCAPDNLEEAAIWGTISASFAIEQIGMPVLSQSGDGETWNGVGVQDRLSDFKQRLASYVQP
ncbi:Ribokinase-like protein [Alternaria alternata]|uniref:Ribokinase-like protein n=1 Tax=Alternaria alternata TaxID=5599 RepID=A0A177DIW9_ALTAL|nr:Ribokinase-like protein [Alternaria alternata]OAG19287.1 Ribokinase-like protein [Alternaria alternata]